ncbi:MAG: hypothetical protein V8Q54_02350 [Alistipes senegalensis]
MHKAKGLEKRAVVIPYCSWPLDPKSSGMVQNIVWAEARGEAAGEIGRFPVRYKRAMAESDFSAEYYRELVYAHVDNVNLLYVALTRAAESLHVFVPQKGGAPNVGGVLLQSIRVDGDRAPVGDTRRALHDRRAGRTLRLRGVRRPRRRRRESVPKRSTYLLEEYPTAHAALRLRLPSQRYFEDGADAELAPRNLGILMHKAFEQAEDERQIRDAVRRMQADGTLSADDAAPLRQKPSTGRWNTPRSANGSAADGSRSATRSEIILPPRRTAPSRRHDDTPTTARRRTARHRPA